MDTQNLNAIKEQIKVLEKQLFELRTDYTKAKNSGINLPEIEERINDLSRKISLLKLNYMT